MVVNWEVPPTRSSSRWGEGTFADIRDELKKHPGEWAKLKEHATLTKASGSAYQYRIRKDTAGFEFQAREGTVYVRYVGGEEETDDS